MVGISTGLSERPLRAKPVQPGAYKERDQEENPAPCSYPTPMQLVYKSTRQWLRPARRFPLFMLEPLRLFFSHRLRQHPGNFTPGLADQTPPGIVPV